MRNHVHEPVPLGRTTTKKQHDNNARLIVSYPILCVAFSMIRYVLYTLTHLLTLARCDIYIYYLYRCQHKYNPWLTTTHWHRIRYCCVYSLRFASSFFLLLLPTFAPFVARFYFIECARNIWNWLWPPKVEFHLYVFIFICEVSMFFSHATLISYGGLGDGGIVSMCAVCSCVLMFYFCTLRNKQ